MTNERPERPQGMPDMHGGPGGFGGPGGPGMPPGPGGPGGFGGPGGPGADFRMEDADVSGVTRKWLDLPYASLSQAQMLDIYLPETGEGPFPIVIHIHGGGFALGDKRDFLFAPYLRALERGYGVVSVNYRLSGEAIFPAGLQDVKASIRWLKAHGAEYSLDASRIAACGGSAGGNFAAMLAITSSVSAFDDATLGNAEYPCDVRVAVDQFGPIDFLTMDEQAAANGVGLSDHSQAGSPESKYIGAPLAEVPERVRLASPATYLNNDMSPILIQHGRADAFVPYQQSVDFARAIEEKVGRDRFEIDLFDGAEHADPLFRSERNLARVFGFLDRYLK